MQDNWDTESSSSHESAGSYKLYAYVMYTACMHHTFLQSLTRICLAFEDCLLPSPSPLHTHTGTPYQTTPVVQQPPPKVVFQQQRERLYRAGPGRYHAIQDVEPQQPGDLALRKGKQVEGWALFGVHLHVFPAIRLGYKQFFDSSWSCILRHIRNINHLTW